MYRKNFHHVALTLAEDRYFELESCSYHRYTVFTSEASGETISGTSRVPLAIRRKEVAINANHLDIIPLIF